eukprot:4199209-Alexandrium_andersonii.AAC.1
MPMCPLAKTFRAHAGTHIASTVHANTSTIAASAELAEIASATGALAVVAHRGALAGICNSSLLTLSGPSLDPPIC